MVGYTGPIIKMTNERLVQYITNIKLYNITFHSFRILIYLLLMDLVVMSHMIITVIIHY